MLFLGLGELLNLAPKILVVGLDPLDVSLGHRQFPLKALDLTGLFSTLSVLDRLPSLFLNPLDAEDGTHRSQDGPSDPNEDPEGNSSDEGPVHNTTIPYLDPR